MDERDESRLKRLTLVALDRYRNGEPFTSEEVSTYLECVKIVFGESEASGFLNLVLDAIKRYGYENLGNNFGMAVVVAIGEEAARAKAKRIKENIFPNVPDVYFEFCAGAMYMVDDEGLRHRITRAGVCANGVRDLCIYWKGPGMYDVTVGKTAEVAKERVLSIPKGDILWMKFEPPLDGGRCSFYLDIGSEAEIKGMVREMFRRFGGKKGSGYDMFGGEQYHDA